MNISLSFQLHLLMHYSNVPNKNNVTRHDCLQIQVARNYQMQTMHKLYCLRNILYLNCTVYFNSTEYPDFYLIQYNETLCEL